MSPPERRLADIWEAVLGVEVLSAEDHFFSIGGDSLAAVTMMLDVEESFGVSLPARVVFEAPTVAELARLIEHAQGEPAPLRNERFVYPIVTAGSGVPVFFTGADLKLARPGMWSLDCPLYAVTHWALGSGFADAASVEELARLHVDGIRKVQATGPYRIAGYSFGGLLALEIAQQLHASGEVVELLFALDPMEPAHIRDSAQGAEMRIDRATLPAEALVDRVRRHGRDVPRDVRGAVDYLERRVRLRVSRAGAALKRLRAWQWLCYRIVHWHGKRPNPVSTALLPRDRWPAFWYASVRLAKDYVATPYDGPALAIVTNPVRADCWRALFESADVEELEGRHHNLMVQPTLGIWLTALAARLEH